jgi:hypothetical protein
MRDGADYDNKAIYRNNGIEYVQGLKAQFCGSDRKTNRMNLIICLFSHSDPLVMLAKA